MTANTTIRDWVIYAAEGLQVAASALPTSTARTSAHVASGLIGLLVAMLDRGMTADEITTRLTGAPSLRDTIADDDQAALDAVAARFRRSEPPDDDDNGGTL